MAIVLTSPAFADGAAIPDRYTKDEDNVPPPLKWSGVPNGAAELALTVHDPDAPDGTFVHWVLTGLSPELRGLDGMALRSATEARNSWDEVGYGGPKPPPGDEPHRYVFTLYALGRPSGVGPDATYQDFHEATRGEVLDEGTLVGRYGAPGS